MNNAVNQIQNPTALALGGALCFGAVVGYITYRVLVRTTAKATINDLGVVIAAIGGGTGTILFGSSSGSMFGMYAIGLLGGMVLYFLAYLAIGGKNELSVVLGRGGQGPRKDADAPHGGDGPRQD